MTGRTVAQAQCYSRHRTHMRCLQFELPGQRPNCSLRRTARGPTSEPLNQLVWLASAATCLRRPSSSTCLARPLSNCCRKCHSAVLPFSSSQPHGNVTPRHPSHDNGRPATRGTPGPATAMWIASRTGQAQPVHGRSHALPRPHSYSKIGFLCYPYLATRKLLPGTAAGTVLRLRIAYPLPG